MKQLLGKRVLAVLLSAVMVAALAFTAIATYTPEKAAEANRSVTVTKVDADAKLGKTNKADLDKSPAFADNDVVRVSIVLPGKSVLKAGYSAKNYAENKSAVSYRNSLKIAQAALADKISARALDGEKLDVVWNLTLAANIISANVPYGKINAIKNTMGVADVIIETEYLPEETAQPDMAISTVMTNNIYAWAAGYTGAGSKIAIVDTGLDFMHKSFDPEAFEYAISLVNEERADEGKDLIQLMTAEDVDAVWEELNIADRITAPDGVYVNAKVPFGVNYVDKDLDFTHEGDNKGEHGSHVAGIAAANRFVKDEETGDFVSALDAVNTQGEAPDAQLLIMKVFGKGGGAYDSDYMVAIEDAITLGADSVNLSLGSSAAGFTTNATYADIIASLEDSDIIWSNSAGNNYAWTHFTNISEAYGYDLLKEGDINFHTGGSPATYKNTLAVASVDNDGQTGNTLSFNDHNIFFAESPTYGNNPIVTIKGTHKFVYIDTAGTDADFAAVADILEGKIALCNRGETSFYMKANAAVANGAIATIIVNNQPGVINMNLTGYAYNAPAVTILQSDGLTIKAEAEALDGYAFPVYVGEITVNDVVISEYSDSEYKTMSDFSSWGGNGALTIKPEITAPGGNIWSVNGDHVTNATDFAHGHNNYELMSGTSMASPQIAGIAAVVAQYIRDNDGVAEGMTQRQLAQSLLMSTAKPLMEEGAYYYSVMKQGAGLVDVNAVINSRSYILMDESATESAADGKVKAEIGEIERGDSFTVAFDLVNFSDAPILYNLNADFFTQDIWYGFRWQDTTPINAAIVWTVNGEEIEPVSMDLDFDGNGIVNAIDADYLLDYTAGLTEELYNEEYADLDEDGDVDTHDAYLAFKLLGSIETVLGAGERVHIEAEVTVEIPEELDVNGNWIEGYIFVKEGDTEDGALGVVHSIPVLGFWGSISDASMYDTDEDIDGDEEPDFYVPNGADGTYAFIGTDGYVLGGNPMVADAEEHVERYAFNPNNVGIGSVYFTQIRNAGASRFYAMNQYGRVITGSEIPCGQLYAAYYNQNQGAWQQTANRVSVNYLPRGLREGQQIVLGFDLAPEYYVKEDGSVDWSRLGAGSSIYLPLTVDTLDPQIVSVSFDESDSLLIIEAHDENYVSAIAVWSQDGDLVTYAGADDIIPVSALSTMDPADVRKGDQIAAIFDLSDADLETGHFLVEVYDYAANYSAYKLNTHPEELEEPLEVSVEIDQGEYISIVGKNSLQLTATVLPWGFEYDDVVWTIDDQFDAETFEDAEVITLTEDGLVTVIADSDGYAIITATSEYDPEASASAIIEVKFIDKQLNGVVWDESGLVWVSDFNLKSIPEYEKLNESSLNLPIAGLAYDQNDTLYAATFDSDEWLSDLYILDPATLETKLVGSSEIGYMDITSAPSLDSNHLLAVYGYYVVIVNKDTGDYEGFFDLSTYTGGSYFVGIAYEEAYYNRTYRAYVDYVWLIDESGTVYNLGIMPYNGSYANFRPSTAGQIGDPVDTPYFQSLYYDGASLYWSRYNGADNFVEIIMVNDIYNDGSIYNVGKFADNVWPVAGLCELGINPATGFSEIERSSAEIDGMMSTERIEKIDFSRKPAAGSLNSIKDLDPTGELESVNTDVHIGVEVPFGTTNGLIVVDYDPARACLSKYNTYADHVSVKESTGKLVIAYTFDIDEITDDEPVSEIGDDVEEILVLDLHFAYGSEGIVLITDEEINNDHPATETKVFLGGYPVDPIPEDYSEPVWTWNDDLTEAYATFTRSDGVTKTVDAEVTVELTETDNGLKNVYLATVEFNGEIYTDSIEIAGVFAGWYKDALFTDPYTETPGEDDVKYAKLVDPETFKLIAQVSEMYDDAEAKARLVTTIDSEFYREVRFELTYGDDEKTYTLTTFYRALTEDLDLEGMDDPTVFSADSKYFASKKVALPFNAFNKTITAKAIFVTCDGTEVEGGTIEFVIPIDYAFAGWYKDADFTDPYTEAPGEDDEKYAKFIDPATFDLLAQISEPAPGDTDAKVRLVTTIDSEFYQKVIFELTYGESGKTYTLTTFYRELTEVLDLEAMEDPTVFSADSKYFASKKAALPAEAFNQTITAKAIFVTCDGTEVEGGTIEFVIPMDYVFAGWYHDAEFTDPYTEAPGEEDEAYAKYVHKDTFKTVVQLVEPAEGDIGFKARFVTSVDSAFYKQVEIKIEYPEGSKSYTLNKFYRALSETLGLEALDDPKALFSEDSEYFASKKSLIEDDNAVGVEVTVYAVFTTCDGTVVEGEHTVFTVEPYTEAPEPEPEP